ncbi:MAG: methyltransferase, TIGR04325 family [Methylophilaceae bacterium]|jgi:putative methyltransferase (TIGR04325 family)|nr:methyltransferase, TIGR04325 family [Methylophilaceae bacterium]
MKKWNGKIWEGVYESFYEAPKNTDFFNKRKWLEQEESKCDKKRRLFNNSDNSYISKLALTNDYCLPSILSTMLTKNEVITVLDFGGGLGSLYYETLELTVNKKNIRFIIVENNSICSIGNDFFNADSNVEFLTELPKLKNDHKINLIHAGSSMHYVDDWKKLLDIFAKYQPKYMIFADLPAGDIETFVTIQNQYGDKAPVRFWNLKEFVDIVEDKGYELIFKSRFVNPYIDAMQHFDKRHRLEYFSQLVFKLN